VKTILFVCTGNTCRSSMAQALFKKLLKEKGIEDIEVQSAGLAAVEGDEAAWQAVRVMQRRGVDLSQHRARRIGPDLINKADLILTMTGRHKMHLISMYPEAAHKVHVLKEYAYDGRISPESAQILDPFGQPPEIYEECALDLEEALEKLVEKLTK